MKMLYQKISLDLNHKEKYIILTLRVSVYIVYGTPARFRNATLTPDLWYKHVPFIMYKKVTFKKK